MKTRKTTTSKAKKATKSSVSKRVTSKEKKMQYTDGKASAVDEKQRIRDLEELLNPRGAYNPFKANSEEKFEENMASMSIPELQSLAVEVGVFPSGNKTTLKTKLKKEFRSRHFLGKGKVTQSTKPVADINTMTEAQKKLFNLE